ncbi:MAG: hypothetical protein ACK47B_21020 [Armatimonadota bacterium]
MLDLDAPIVPGLCAAGISLGESAETILAWRPNRESILPDGCTRLEFGPVHVWLKDQAVMQIGVYRGYTGRLAERIGIASTIAEVESLLGPVIEDEEDNLVVAAVPGWCFETEEWVRQGGPRKNTVSRIVGIFVFQADRELAP